MNQETFIIPHVSLQLNKDLFPLLSEKNFFTQDSYS